MRVITATAVALLILILVIGGVSHHRYAAAWAAVELASSHLESSIQYEPVITMQAKMADLDVVLKQYIATRPPVLRNFIQRGKSVVDYQQVLSDLSEGLHHESTLQDTEIPQEEWKALGITDFSNVELVVSCDRGKPVVYRGVLH